MEISNEISIPKGKYAGYMWDSDKKCPTIFNNEILEERVYSASSNPFIIEAQLYDEDNSKSYSIKYIDGTYYFTCYEVEESGIYQLKTYLASFDKAPGGTLCFRQYWREVTDNQCGMNTLCPQEFVFVGFKGK